MNHDINTTHTAARPRVSFDSPGGDGGGWQTAEAAAAPQPDPLAALLAATAAGDRAAFRRLYDATAPKLLGVALRLLHHRATAEDALQDAYIRIFTKAPQFDPARGAALAWMARVVRNVALDLLHSRKPHDDLADHTALAAPEVPVALQLDLDRALASLPPGHRDVLLRCYLHGDTSEQAAAAAGVPVGTAKAWVRGGAERMRTRLCA